ncbi:hypothetical protein Br6_04928 [Rhodococcus sp. Br-6]|nr:hypothetical protein Br6_04928 [Rhodococcus sp. Br-6]
MNRLRLAQNALSEEGIFSGLGVEDAAISAIFGPSLKSLSALIATATRQRDALIDEAITKGMPIKHISDDAGVARNTVIRRRNALNGE